MQHRIYHGLPCVTSAAYGFWLVCLVLPRMISIVGDYHQCCGGISLVLWRDTIQYYGELSILQKDTIITVHSRYYFYIVCGIPLLYWISSTALMVSIHSSDVIPQQYWKILKNSDVIHLKYVLNILHSTKYPPKYWWYPPQYWKLSRVLNILRSTNCIRLLYWWYPSIVLNVLHNTDDIPHPLLKTLNSTVQTFPREVTNSVGHQDQQSLYFHFL